MKKILIIIIMSIALNCYSQTVQERIIAKKAEFKTIVEQIEKLKMEQNFVQINPDTLDSKKGIIFMGKKNGKVLYYLKLNNNYLMIDVNATLKMGDQYYNLKSENDSLGLYGDKGVKLYSIK